ncbi:MAG: phosphate signaling complex protein PhoU [Victivallales bacterium]
MKVHLHKEIDHLKKDILILGSMVEGALRHALEAIVDRDAEKAEKVINNDTYIDRKEIEIEEECLKILALHQPVAADLRYVTACLKVNNELERIGDLGANIAQRAIDTANSPETDMRVDFKPMMDVAGEMLRQALNSLICMDSGKAMEVIAEDDVVDEYNRKMFAELQKAIHRKPKCTEYFVNLMSVSRHLERIADCATNISEDVVYMIEGKIIRHQK